MGDRFLACISISSLYAIYLPDNETCLHLFLQQEQYVICLKMYTYVSLSREPFWDIILSFICYLVCKTNDIELLRVVFALRH